MKVEATSEAKKDMAKIFGYRFDEDSYFPWWEENILWPIEKRWRDIVSVPKRIKWFWQRGTRGFSDRDSWDVHSWLAEIIPGAIARMREYDNSYPSIFIKKGKTHDQAKGDWHNVLKEIEDGFKAWQEIDGIGHDLPTDENIQRRKKFDRGMKLLHKYFDCLWD